jgi:DNA-binding HxlR family transcriptional regulator
VEDAPVPDRALAIIVGELADILGVCPEDLDTYPPATAALRIIREMTADGTHRSEPVRTILIRIGDRWTPLLVQLLEPAPVRFSQLRRMVITILDEDISKQILSEKLHALERDGFVCRTDLGSARPAVEYSLTPLGASFCARIKELIAWSRDYIPGVRAARVARMTVTLTETDSIGRSQTRAPGVGVFVDST